MRVPRNAEVVFATEVKLVECENGIRRGTGLFLPHAGNQLTRVREVRAQVDAVHLRQPCRSLERLAVGRHNFRVGLCGPGVRRIMRLSARALSASALGR